MCKPSFLRKLRIVCRYLLVFRKPTFSELDFIDLVIDDKALFLLTWKLEDAYKVQIRKTRSTFWETENAVVLLLTKQPDAVDISFSNLWRTTTIRIRLKQTRFDDETAFHLLKQIRAVKRNGEVVWNTPLSLLTVYPFHIAMNKTAPILHNSTPVIHPPQSVINKKPVIQSHKLIYQQ